MNGTNKMNNQKDTNNEILNRIDENRETLGAVEKIRNIIIEPTVFNIYLTEGKVPRKLLKQIPRILFIDNFRVERSRTRKLMIIAKAANFQHDGGMFPSTLVLSENDG